MKSRFVEAFIELQPNGQSFHSLRIKGLMTAAIKHNFTIMAKSKAIPITGLGSL
jgi:hypothetical protein